MNNQILVVEDHKAIRILLSNFLGKSFAVKTVSNGFEGIAWMNDGNFPHLIILDINMPNLGGIEFLMNLRNSGFFENIPVIVVSAEENGAVIEKCIELGISGYLKKPFDPNELKKKILTIFDKNRNPLNISIGQ